MIRVDAVWLAVEPFDMRRGVEAALAWVVKVFGAARPHHTYLFANRMKVPEWGEQICATHHAADRCRSGIVTDDSGVVTDIPAEVRNRSR